MTSLNDRIDKALDEFDAWALRRAWVSALENDDTDAQDELRADHPDVEFSDRGIVDQWHDSDDEAVDMLWTAADVLRDVRLRADGQADIVDDLFERVKALCTPDGLNGGNLVDLMSEFFEEMGYHLPEPHDEFLCTACGEDMPGCTSCLNPQCPSNEHLDQDEVRRPRWMEVDPTTGIHPDD